MDQSGLRRARAALDDMRQWILHPTHGRLADDHDPSGDPGDEHDAAWDERERKIHALLSYRDRLKLEAVEQALARMDEGRYGICEECEDEIDDARLEVLPFTRVCVMCQAERERDQRHSRGRLERPAVLALGDPDDRE